MSTKLPSEKEQIIYTLLGRMVEKGFVKKGRPSKDPHKGIPRPIYTLTARGERLSKTV